MINILATLVERRVRSCPAAPKLCANQGSPHSSSPLTECPSPARSRRGHDRAPPPLEPLLPWPAPVTASVLTHFAELAGRCMGIVHSKETRHDDDTDSELPP